MHEHGQGWHASYEICLVKRWECCCCVFGLQKCRLLCVLQMQWRATGVSAAHESHGGMAMMIRKWVLQLTA